VRGLVLIQLTGHVPPSMILSKLRAGGIPPIVPDLWDLSDVSVRSASSLR